ncbi:MAG: amidohydrolase [Actinobacteria bacterium]|nr:amidohydrolase [Actinomycetota bacterium]
MEHASHIDSHTRATRDRDVEQRSGGRVSADVAIVGAAIRTLDPARPHATAVAIRDGVIVAVGHDASVGEHCDSRTEILDGRGMAIVPGLTDCHLHPMWASEFAVGLNVARYTRPEALAAALAVERRRIGPEAVLRAWGVDRRAFADAPLDGRELESRAGGPALLVFPDLHTYLATPTVLDAAGITGAETFPDGSEIVMRDGRPTGELHEFSAFRLVERALPDADPATRRQRITDVMRQMNAVGLTGAHVMDGSPETFELLRDLEARGELTMRLVVPLWVKPEHDDDRLAEYEQLVDERGRLWRGGVVKLFIDGVVESGTAWLERPDAFGQCTRPYWPSEARYAATVARFAAAGFQCATHAIGDRAVRAVLDAYAGAARPPRNRGMHRIEHVETLPDRELARFAREGVAASMQPLHMQWREHDQSDEWSVRLGQDRVALTVRTRDLQQLDVPIALGSDWPVADFDPRVGMAWARLRRAPGTAPEAAFEPEQALGAHATLAGYTTTAASIVGDAAVGGRIAEGMRADLTAFATDPVDIPADELPDNPVLLTIVGGRVTHRAA